MSERRRPLRTVSVIHKEEKSVLKGAHSELKDVLEEITQLKTSNFLKSLMNDYNESDYMTVNASLKEKLLKPFEQFSTADQRKVIGNHIVDSGLISDLIDYYKFLAEDEGDLEGDFIDAKIMRNIREILWNYSDLSEDMRSAITDRQDMLGFLALNLKSLADQEVNKQCFAFASAVGILNNCSRGQAPTSTYHNVTVVFDEKEKHLNLVECLLPFLEKGDEYVRLTTLLVLSRIIDEKQNHLLEAKSFVFDFLLDIIKKAMKDVDRRCHGFSLDELVDGLAHIAKNDKNKKIIMEKGALGILKEIVIKGNDMEKLAAVHAIWELSYVKENAELFKADKEICRCLLELKSSPISDLAADAKFTCFEIGLEREEEIRTNVSASLPPPPPPPPSAEDPSKSYNRPENTRTEEKDHAGHIMISYNWKHQSILLNVYDRLKAAGFKLWMDVYNLKGELLDGMTDAIENADVVLICFSEQYKKSNNCRTEGKYTNDVYKRTGKPKIIPLKVDKYVADGWLGGLIADMMWYDVSKPGDGFENAIVSLIKVLKDATSDKNTVSKPNENKPKEVTEIVLKDVNQNKKSTSNPNEESTEVVTNKTSVIIKVWGLDRKIRHAVKVMDITIKDLEESVREKFKFKSAQQLSFYIEKDGTNIDEDELLEEYKHEILVVSTGEQWIPANNAELDHGKQNKNGSSACNML